MTDSVTFHLNGRPVTITDPSPDLLLIDYLRAPGVALTGAKPACGQGGCGACAVLLSSWDAQAERAVHRTVNACLRPVCALDGMAVTTIEGTGTPTRPAPEHLVHHSACARGGAPAAHATPSEIAAARASAAARQAAAEDVALAAGAPEDPPPGMNPVAYRLAMNNGTRCGYCAPGFVMTMCGLLEDDPEPSKRAIEDAFDGNLCRCTGYRSILTGMKTFAGDWAEIDEQERQACVGEQALAAVVPGPLPDLGPPAAARVPPSPVEIFTEGKVWLRPTALADVGAILREYQGRQVRLVHGNTSYGVYPTEVRAAEVLVDIQAVPELVGVETGAEWIDVGAATTYRELISVLTGLDQAEDTAVGALLLMARRTAGALVRNSATLAGNTMLVLQHIRRDEPFPSDLMTALVAIGAEITVWQPLLGEESARLPIGELVDRVVDDPVLLEGLVLRTYHLPVLPPTVKVFAQKVALREVNAHSLVNATTVVQLDGTTVVDTAVVFGGIAPYPWHARATEAALRGSALDLDGFDKPAAVLEEEVRAELDRWLERMAEVPWEGVTDDYRVRLAESFLYKAIVNALLTAEPEAVPPGIRSAGVGAWGRWPVSSGSQTYEVQPWKAPVSQPYLKLGAFYEATGAVRYTHETPVPPTTAHAAFVRSLRALADYHFVASGAEEPADRSTLSRHLAGRCPGFVELVTHEHVPPQGINLQGMGGDQPLLAARRVSHVGQAIAVVVAESAESAQQIADYVTQFCIAYRPVEWEAPYDKPVLTLEHALEVGSVFPDHPESAEFTAHIWQITRPGSDLRWVRDREPSDREITKSSAVVSGVNCVVVSGAQTTGGQAHFSLETQACVVEPLDGDRWRIVPSTVDPMAAHQTAAMALGVEYHRIEVDVPRVGGATEQARFVVGPAVVAAHAVRRPLRLVLPRDGDTAMLGKRHAFHGQYQIAIDATTGLIHGLDARLWGDGGAFYDCSFVAADRVQLHADNAYLVPNSRTQVDICRTNKTPGTASGDIQGRIILETAIDDAAFAAGIDPADVRERNLYHRGDVTPYGQALTHCYLREVWTYLREKCDYDRQKIAVDAFNRTNRWRKRGIAMMPVKHGTGLTQADQSTAHVIAYAGDGSVVIHHGGVESGQGLTTRVEQVASYVLGIPFDLIHVNGPSTSLSTGTHHSVEAVKQACERLRARLTEFGNRMLKDNGPEWCARQQIDFWNHPEHGWATSVPGPGDTHRLIWQNLVQVAHRLREDLTVSHTARIPGGEIPLPAPTVKPMADQHDIPGITVARDARVDSRVDTFHDFTYSAACSVVEVDILTGETKVLRSDLVFDVGWSLNPALDIGQVEGGFVQGIGHVLTEQLVHQPDGPETGRLNTTNTWRYQPPAVPTIPLRLNTHLFPRDLAALPDDSLSTKEIGEAPMTLATTVFLAVKSAIRSSRLERGLDGLFPLDAPATVQEVRQAAAVTLTPPPAPAEPEE
ncbi:molybdopterin cofactor-binding domain-containing protein [Actinokineospora enzanensis]|uniref:molybdopterin cofactor-binding domain-containing protein n=1 Tax=Actinokineospora enzanensis TaxID=155975 RepID=UPI0003676D57|nr:molybdopterin cofactor-binding domain-containing protein [Actinokineospora enzanensis]